MQIEKANAHTLREGDYVRFTNEGAGNRHHLGRLVKRSQGLFAVVKDAHMSYTPGIVRKSADPWENMSSAFPGDIHDVEKITVEPGDEVEYNYGMEGRQFRGHLFKSQDGNGFLRSGTEASPDGYLPNVIDPVTSALAGGISDLWPIIPAEEDSVATEPSPETEAKILRQRVEDLERMNSTQNERIRTLLTDHEAFKRGVGEKAMELAEEHDWCSVVEGALGEMGVEVPTREHEVRVTVELVFTGQSSNRHPDTGWAHSSIVVDEDDGEATIKLDGDWENVAVAVDGYSVNSCEKV